MTRMDHLRGKSLWPCFRALEQKAGDKYFEENGFLDHQFSVPRLKQGIVLVFFTVGKGAGTGCAGTRY